MVRIGSLLFGGELADHEDGEIAVEKKIEDTE